MTLSSSLSRQLSYTDSIWKQVPRVGHSNDFRFEQKCHGGPEGNGRVVTVGGAAEVRLRLGVRYGCLVAWRMNWVA
jgi:hypothetical protein